MTLDPAGPEVLLFPRTPPRVMPVGPDRGATIELRDAPDPARDFATVPYPLLLAAGLCLGLGILPRAAQLPLMVWARATAVAPAPAAAMVHTLLAGAAALALLARCYPVFVPEALTVLAVLAAGSMVWAGLRAARLVDLRQILAHLAVVPAGLVVLGLAAGGWDAGVFYLLTSVLALALLFLGAGCVEHLTGDVSDIRKLGGLFAKMPEVGGTTLVAVLALAGVPLLFGWASAAAPLAWVAADGWVAWPRGGALLALCAAAGLALQAYAAWRLWVWTFAGTPRDGEIHERVTEPPPLLTVPLGPLALLVALFVWSWPPGYYVPNWLEAWLRLDRPPGGPPEVAAVRAFADRFHAVGEWLVLVAASAGTVAAARWVANRPVPEGAAPKLGVPWAEGGVWPRWVLPWPGALGRGLAYADGAIDRAAALLVVGVARLARVPGWVERVLVDGVPTRLARGVYRLGANLRHAQAGYAGAVAWAVALGLVAAAVVAAYATAGPR